MPFTITNEGTYLKARMHGVLTEEDLRRFADEVTTLEDALPAPLHRVADLTEVERFAIAFVDIQSLAAKRRVATFATPVKSAIIARQASKSGLRACFRR